MDFSPDPDVRVRENALHALQFVEPLEPLPLAALTNALTDPDRQIKWAAIQTLRNLGSRATNSIPALHDVAREDKSLRDAAQHAIQKIEGKAGSPMKP